MILTRLSGGLGNQLFQFAAGLALAQKHQTKLKLDMSEYRHNLYRAYQLDHFHISAQQSSFLENYMATLAVRFPWKLLSDKLYPYTVYTESTFGYDSTFESLHDKTYLRGHWFSYKYLQGVEKLVRKELVFSPLKTPSVKALETQIRKKPSVFIHVRRGDYVTHPKFSKIYVTQPVSYYQQAVKLISSRIKAFQILVFSDDIDWCKTHLDLQNYPHTFVSEQTSSAIEDLYLMTQCDHGIISNSSFSWWGAWLINSPDKILTTPKKWFKDGRKTSDICPEEWEEV